MNRNHDQRRQRERSSAVARRGAVLVVAMVCALVAVMLFGTLLKITVAGHGRLRNEERRVQADWLVEAGIERAAALLQSDSEYAGETWQIDAEELGGRFDGRVEITVKTNAKQAGFRLVTVQAHFPSGTEQSFQSIKQVAIAVSQVSKNAEASRR